MKYIYLSGPITHDGKQTFRRLHEAACLHSKLMKMGFAPFTPHLLAQADMSSDEPITYEDWMIFDFAWIDKCDCVVRLPGESSGADREVSYALEHYKPVYSLDEFMDLISPFGGVDETA